MSACRRKTTLHQAEQAWRDDLERKMVVPCTWMQNLKDQGRYEKTLADHEKFANHITQHARKPANPVCRFGDCTKSANQRPLKSLEEWAIHIAEKHFVAYYKPGAHVSSSFWCAFCVDYVNLGLPVLQQELRTILGT